MPTVLDVAKVAGVAPITVSRVINNSGYISQETKEKVEAAIIELGYVPNTLARGLRSKRTNSLALVVADITNPYFTSMARGVEDVAGSSGYSVIYCNTDESETKEDKYANILVQRQVDGVLLVPAGGNARTVKYLENNKIDVVVLDRRVPEKNTNLVCSDSVNGAKELTDLLIKLGHQQIAIITGPDNVSTSTDRVVGYRNSLEEAGLSANEQVYFGGFNQQTGYESTRIAMRSSQKPTAFFAANNFILIGVVKALRELNLKVPEDVSVVGFDDFPESMLIEPFFTVAIQPAYEMGQKAAELLIKQINGEIVDNSQTIILPTDIIVRRSAGPVRNNPR
ncbi:MAG: LacI family transcriptional regulator [Leptolinea sp.]|nr:LacI family transcriptional regulator [Leptolinea sp.]